MPPSRQLPSALDHRVVSATVVLMRLATLTIKFVLNLFIAKYLGFESLGVYGLIATSCIVAPAVLSLGFSNIINRRAITQSLDRTVGELKNYARYLSIPYVAILISTIIWCVVTKTWMTPMLVVSIIILEHVNSDIYYLLLNLSRPILANSLHFLRAGFWSLIYMIAAFYEEPLRNLDSLLWAYLVASIITLLIFFIATRDWPWLHKNREFGLREWAKREFKFSGPLYINGLADTIGQHLDRYVVTFILGLELAGVYVFYTQIVTAMSNLLHTGVIQIAKPKLVKAFSEKDQSYTAVYKTCLRQTLLISIAMSVAAAGVTYFILPYLKLDLALEWYPVFLLVLAGFVVLTLAQVRDLIMYSQHEDGITLKMSLAYFASKLILSVTCMPLLSLWGAGITALASSAFKFALQTLYLPALLDKSKPKSG